MILSTDPKNVLYWESFREEDRFIFKTGSLFYRRLLALKKLHDFLLTEGGNLYSSKCGVSEKLFTRSLVKTSIQKSCPNTKHSGKDIGRCGTYRLHECNN